LIKRKNTFQDLAAALVSGGDFHSLISRLLRMLLTETGAERVCLFHQDAADLVLVAQVFEHEPPQFSSITLAACSDVPQTIIRYVANNNIAVTLLGPSVAPFESDPYLRCRHHQSIICLPIIRPMPIMGLEGVLYLEGSAMTEAADIDMGTVTVIGRPPVRSTILLTSSCGKA
jgi:GAF domain-containing protein